MEKKAKVVNCVFTNEWPNPGGGITYYHDIELANGDRGSVGTNQMNHPKIKKGVTITYTIDEKGKIKVLTSTYMDNNQGGGNQNQSPAPQKSQSTGSYQRKQSQDQFLGYAWSYAKDLIVAGKGMNDVEELNKVARYIYDEIGKMLNNEGPF